MCWQCDHPQSTYTDYLDQVCGIVDRTGWFVQQIEGDRLHPPWVYTVGLTLCSLPELVVTGMPLPEATSLLNGVTEHVRHAEAPRPGEQIPLVGGPLIEVVQVAEPTAHLNLALNLYGPQIQALQLVHADDRGHWPWDRSYRGIRGGQPVLGIRSPTATALPPNGSG
jgi:hypothetical protein